MTAFFVLSTSFPQSAVIYTTPKVTTLSRNETQRRRRSDERERWGNKIRPRSSNEKQKKKTQRTKIKKSISEKGMLACRWTNAYAPNKQTKKTWQASPSLLSSFAPFSSFSREQMPNSISVSLCFSLLLSDLLCSLIILFCFPFCYLFLCAMQ